MHTTRASATVRSTDRDYILYHLTAIPLEGGANPKETLAVKENALHAIEDFLMARFAWYSQVVRNSSSAKFDVLASHIASYLLEQNQIYSFPTLLQLAQTDSERFFSFNDHYFMTRVQDLYWSKKVQDPILNEKLRMLIYRIPPVTLRLPESRHRILEIKTDGTVLGKILRQLHTRIEEIENLFKKKGTGRGMDLAGYSFSRNHFHKKPADFTERQRPSSCF